MFISGPNPLPTHTFISLVDGENLVFRFQAMAKTRKVTTNTVHIPDVCIWHQYMGQATKWSALRVNYYTSATATDDKIAELEEQISNVPLVGNLSPNPHVCPRVFKKEARSKKTKIVDLSIAIDALRHSYHRHVDAVWLFSGDGDYLPLIREVMRSGTLVWLGAFSDGLNPALPRAVDRFVDLDKWFFVE